MRRVNEKQDQVKVQKQPAKPRDILIQMVYSTGSVEQVKPIIKSDITPSFALATFRPVSISRTCRDSEALSRYFRCEI